MIVMKYLVRIVVLAIIIGISTGFYLQNTGQEVLGNKFIGFSSLSLAFIAMPLFIVYRFRKSSSSKYIFSPTEKNRELEDYIIKGDKDL